MSRSTVSLSIMEEPKLVWDDTENAENHQNGEKSRYSMQILILMIKNSIVIFF